jgi:hypothetical protein
LISKIGILNLKNIKTKRIKETYHKRSLKVKIHFGLFVANQTPLMFTALQLKILSVVQLLTPAAQQMKKLSLFSPMMSGTINSLLIVLLQPWTNVELFSKITFLTMKKKRPKILTLEIFQAIWTLS